MQIYFWKFPPGYWPGFEAAVYTQGNWPVRRYRSVPAQNLSVRKPFRFEVKK